jgi:integrase
MSRNPITGIAWDSQGSAHFIDNTRCMRVSEPLCLYPDLYTTEWEDSMGTAGRHYLWNRGSGQRQNWYARIPIPNKLRCRPPFSDDGKAHPHVIKPLHTGDLREAQRIRDRLVPLYRNAFDRLLAGEQLSLAQIEKDVAVDYEAMRRGFLEHFRTRRQQWREDTRRLLDEYEEKHGPLQIASDPAGRAKDLAALEAIGALRVDAVRAVEVTPLMRVIEPDVGETLSEAAKEFLDDLKRSSAPLTVDGHKDRINEFITRVGNIPLSKVTVAMASDFLTELARTRKTRTRNNYYRSMAMLFKNAKKRGRYHTDDHPFKDQYRAVSDREKAEAKRSGYTDPQVFQLLDSLKREVRPAEYTPQAALPWIMLIGAYTGARIEEIAGMKVADVHTVGTNGSSVLVFDFNEIHRDRKRLKNISSTRRVPVHSQIIKAGLMKYISHLPADGALFPGLEARKSKDHKLSCRAGELYGEHLTALGIKTKKLVFHSWRNTLVDKLREAKVPKEEIDAIIGHANGDITYDHYSSGPSLKNLAEYIERVKYERS